MHMFLTKLATLPLVAKLHYKADVFLSFFYSITTVTPLSISADIIVPPFGFVKPFYKNFFALLFYGT